MIRKSVIAALAAVSITITTPFEWARAQFVVFDPSNFAENILQAADMVQQINNQVQSLQNEAVMLDNMAKNFGALMDAYGHAPNGTRTYYLSRSQPPFFFEMVGLLSPSDPVAAFARYLPELKTEYAYWMEGANELKAGQAHRHAVGLDDGSILNRFWDDSDAPRDESYREDVELAAATPRPPAQIYRDIRAGAESGWDFSSRWFADSRTMASIDATEVIPVDLNALMFGFENAIQ